MKCKHCGAEIANDSRFCEFCGKKMKKKMPVWAVLLIVLGGVINLIVVVAFWSLLVGVERDYKYTDSDSVDYAFETPNSEEAPAVDAYAEYGRSNSDESPIAGE